MPTQTIHKIRFLSKTLTVIIAATTLCIAQMAVGQVYGSAPNSYNGAPKPLLIPSTFSQPGGASVADLVEQISPAVVNITVIAVEGDTTSEGQGSGFIISPEGEIVTNYHVIEGGDQIDIVFNNGVTFPAQIVGTDEETDLALLKVSSPQPFPYVQWYSGPPIRIGDWVIAIGNPFGIGQSTSLGIISAIGRDRVESGAYVDYIQTDATINRGNSGGPLFNPKGEVVGVNSAIFSPTGASVGIAFSIPHTTAYDVVEQLRQYGRVRRGWLGAGLRTAELTGGGSSRGGANVNTIVPGGPAQLAGLQVDDIILAINGEPVNSSVDAARIIGRIGPDQQVSLLIERMEQEMAVSLLITERPIKTEVDRARSGQAPQSYVSAPPPMQPAPNRPSAPPRGAGPDIGVSLVDLSANFRDAIGMRYDQVGVYVESVRPGSIAASHGLTSNMVLLELNNEAIPSVAQFTAMLSRAGRGDVLFRVRLVDGNETYVNILLSGGNVGQASFESQDLSSHIIR